MTIHKIYWIKLKTHTDPYTEGYIGVSNDVKRRFSTHRRQALAGKHVNEVLTDAFVTHHEDMLLDVVFEGSESECYEQEKLYRSVKCIGWNLVPGGRGGPHSTGMKMSEEFKEKRRQHMLGNTLASKGRGKPKSTEHREKISEANKGRVVSEEVKRNHSLKMKGRVFSEEHRRKIAEANRGRKRGPYKKRTVLEPVGV